MPYIGRNLRLTEAMQNFIGARELRKGRKAQELQDQYLQSRPKVVSNAQGIFNVYPDGRIEVLYEFEPEPDATKYQQYETDKEYGAFDPGTGQYEKRGEVTPEKKEPKMTIETPEGVKITGGASQVQPYLDQYGTKEPKKPETYPASQARVDTRAEDQAKQMYMSMTTGDKTAEDAWNALPWETKQQWISHARTQLEQGVSSPVVPTITETQPEIEATPWYKRGNQEFQPAQAETTFIDPHAPMGKPSMTPVPQGQPQPGGQTPYDEEFSQYGSWEEFKADYDAHTQQGAKFPPNYYHHALTYFGVGK